MPETTFGPHVSRPLFERRWKERSRAIDDRVGQPPIAPENVTHANATDFMTWELQRNKATLQHVIACSNEARAIGEVPVEGSTTLKSRMRKAQSQASAQLTSAQLSAYEEMELIRASTGHSLSVWHGAKMGRALLFGKVRWEDLPLRLRRQMNELLEEWEMGKDNGGWEIDSELTEMLVAGARSAKLAG